ncbi:MAG: hypothetical protein Q7V05_12670 [Methanoregula sp.]|nr:hypothetical protein [Methanoregula sp.]
MKIPAWLIVFFIICAICITPVSAQNDTKKQVLILVSYNQGMPWADTELSGTQEILARSGLDYELHIEYMDTKRTFNEVHIRNLYTLYKNKYNGTHFDVILCSDNDALNFLLKYRDELFPDTPVVFYGINSSPDNERYCA